MKNMQVIDKYADSEITQQPVNKFAPVANNYKGMKKNTTRA